MSATLEGWMWAIASAPIFEADVRPWFSDAVMMTSLMESMSGAREYTAPLRSGAVMLLYPSDVMVMVPSWALIENRPRVSVTAQALPWVTAAPGTGTRVEASTTLAEKRLCAAEGNPQTNRVRIAINRRFTVNT